MDTLLSLMPAHTWAIAIGIGLLAGLVKGVIGFAMPMILISGLGSIVSPELALAGLILPTLVTNGWQALRQGPRAAIDSVNKFRVFLVVGAVFLVMSAQMVRIIPGHYMLMGLGILVTLFALTQLAGVPIRLSGHPTKRVEATVGAVAGFIGGVSGVWGPPTVALLTAMETEKSEQLRVQGVIYGLGAVLLMGAHVVSGVLSAERLPFSLALIVPAVTGMAIGFAIHDAIPQKTFKKITLAVLLIAGLNLIRRGVFGA